MAADRLTGRYLPVRARQRQGQRDVRPRKVHGPRMRRIFGMKDARHAGRRLPSPCRERKDGEAGVRDLDFFISPGPGLCWRKTGERPCYNSLEIPNTKRRWIFADKSVAARISPGLPRRRESSHERTGSPSSRGPRDCVLKCPLTQPSPCREREHACGSPATLRQSSRTTGVQAAIIAFDGRFGRPAGSMMTASIFAVQMVSPLRERAWSMISRGPRLGR